jgi:16S rRNA C1402 (ribose-2'-O) methylase RsmI
MTKMHEQYVKCDLQELSLKIKNQVIPVKGEFILILEGSKKKNSSNDLLLAKKIIPELIHTNSSSEIINLISKTTTLKRNEIYKIILEMKN